MNRRSFLAALVTGAAYLALPALSGAFAERDDTAYIQDLIDRGGDYVVLPAGEYILRRPLIIHRDMTINGNGSVFHCPGEGCIQLDGYRIGGTA